MLVLILLLLFFIISNSPNPKDIDFWGVTQVSIDGITKQLDCYGYINYKYNIKHSASSRFPIGSNTKLFTAVAIYQLQERGLLNVSHAINQYLNQTDFIKFGFPNQSIWCPHIITSWKNKSVNNCQNITFIQLLSMSSGIIAAMNCPYNASSIFLQYCWDFCNFVYLPYKGCIAYYVGRFINNPLTFIPGTKFEYSNMNFILAAYLIEKFSGLTYSQYIEKNILSKIPLKETYFDPWDGQFGINDNRVDEYFLFKNEDDPLDALGIGTCLPFMNLGMINGAGGMVSTNNDLHIWYKEMFNKTNIIPLVFESEESRKSILYPWTYIEKGLYYTQGLVVKYNNLTINISEDIWPDEILYSGNTLCSESAIRCISNDTILLIVSAMSNAPLVFIPNGEDGLEKLRYDTPLSFCGMVRNYNPLFAYFDGSANTVADQILKKWIN